MQDKILEITSKVITPYGIPAPVDLRETLAKNPSGRKWKTRTLADLRGVVWHQALANGSIEAIAHYHTGDDSHLCQGGVESIAYSYAIRKNGQIVLCNDLEKVTWSQGYKKRVGDENAEFISVLFEGFFKGPGVSDSDAGEPTMEQILSGITLWKVLKAMFRWDDSALLGHCSLGKPACPGGTLQALIESNRANSSVTPVEEEMHKSEILDSEKVEHSESDTSDSTPDDTTAEYKIFSLSTITERQQALRILGYYDGAIDGIWGPKSSAAFMFFQNSAGLTVDGIWGPVSEKAVNDSLNLVV